MSGQITKNRYTLFAKLRENIINFRLSFLFIIRPLLQHWCMSQYQPLGDKRNGGIFLPCNVVFQKINFIETIQNKTLISISFFQRKYWDKTLPCGFHLTAQNWLMSGSMTVKSKEFRYTQPPI